MKWFICMIIIGCGHGLMAISYDTKTPYAPTEMQSSNYGGYCLLGNDRVCGSNGFENFLFDNPCEFNEFNGKQIQARQAVLNKTALADCYPPASAGNYKPYTYCPQFCNRILAPVCASYLNVQRNFTNECELRRYICDTQQNWQIVLNSTCVDASCSLEDQEVCAWYDNVQYAFPSLMSLYADIKKTGRNWHILNVGPCPCPMDYKPVCAQVNCTIKTYQNECFLQRDIVNASYWYVILQGECPMLPTDVPGGCNTTSTTTTTPATTPTTTPATTPTTTPATTQAPPTTSAQLLGASDPSTTPVSNVTTTTPVPPTNTTIAPANCTAGPVIIPIPSMKRPPVYVVSQNKILPYQPNSNLPYVPKYGKNTYSPSAPSAPSSNSYGGASMSVYSSGSYNKPADYISPNTGIGIYTTPRPNNLVYGQTITNNDYNTPISSGYPQPKTTNYNYNNMNPKNYQEPQKYSTTQNIGYNAPISSGYSNSYPNNPANSSELYSKSNVYADMPANGPVSYSGTYSPSKSNNYPAADMTPSNAYKPPAPSGSSGYPQPKTTNYNYNNMEPKDHEVPQKYSTTQNIGYNAPISSGYSNSYPNNPANSSGLYSKSNVYDDMPANGPVSYSGTYSPSKSNNYPAADMTPSNGYKPPAPSGSSGYPQPKTTNYNYNNMKPKDYEVPQKYSTAQNIGYNAPISSGYSNSYPNNPINSSGLYSKSNVYADNPANGPVSYSGTYSPSKSNNYPAADTSQSNGYKSPAPSGSSGYSQPKTTNYNYNNMEPKDHEVPQKYSTTQNIGYNEPISSGYSNSYSPPNNPANSSGLYSKSNLYDNMPAIGPVSYSGTYSPSKPYNYTAAETTQSNRYKSPAPSGSSGYPQPKTTNYHYQKYSTTPTIGYNPPISSGYSNSYNYPNNPANSSGLYSKSNLYDNMPAIGPVSYSGIYSPSKSYNYPAADTTQTNRYKSPAPSGYSKSNSYTNNPPKSIGTYSKPKNYASSDQNNGYKISVSDRPSYDQTPSNTYVYSNTKNVGYNTGYTLSKPKSYGYSVPKTGGVAYSKPKSTDYAPSNVKTNTQYYSPSPISSSIYNIKITPSYANVNYKYSNDDSTDDDDDDDDSFT